MGTGLASEQPALLMRVFLISTVALHREGLAEVLARRDGIDVIGTTADPADVPPEQAGERTIVVLDMSGFESVDTAARVARASDARVLAINVLSRERDVIACAEAGVACCLTAEASIDDLVAAIGSVARGDAPCSPWTAAVLLRRVASLARERRAPVGTHVAEAPRPRLTTRELEIVELVDQGLSNKQIAQQLHIELPTVKNHMHRILNKLGVRRRAEAAELVRSGAAGRPPRRRSTSSTPV